MSKRPRRAASLPALGLILVATVFASALAVAFPSCVRKAGSGKRTIVVTYSVLGSVVKELVGDSFEVKVSIPNGLDPHDWEPSAKDIEAIDRADLVVENGLGLEEGMTKALDAARKAGVRVFTASDHVAVRTVGAGEGIPSGDPDQSVGAEDPHIWTDPVTMRAVADALAEEIKADFGLDLAKRQADLDARYDELDAEVAASVGKLPAERRKLVTGHESRGYFAQRYGFKLVGALVPSLSSQAESTAAGLVALKKLVAAEGVKVVFTETSENPKVALALAAEAGASSVPLATHALPEGGDYAAFVRGLASTVAGALAR
jgi:zinc/manganese transport system substrate-binding protein